MTRIAIAAVLVLLGTNAALAGGSYTLFDIAVHIFAKADADKDGVLTVNEHASAGLGRYGASFGKLDLDNDSRVTWDEYKAVFERYHRPTDEREA